MDNSNEAAAGCSKEVLNGGEKNEYNLEESDAPMVFEPDDWVDYGIDDDENKQSIHSELPSEIETHTLDPPKSKRRKLATFDELLENLDYNILHLNLTKLLQFLESNHKEIRFPFVLKEYTDFFKKIVRNNNLLKSKSLDANYRDICDKIIEAASLKKTGFFLTCTCEYRKGYQNTVLIIKKVYVKQKTDKETMLSSGSTDITMPSSQSSEVDSLSRSSSPAFISSGFKVHCLRTALAFIKNDVTKTKEFPELNLEQAQFMQLLFNSVTVLSDFDSSSETKELYRALWEAVRIHSLKYEFRVQCLDTLGGKKSLVFEKILKRKPVEMAANLNQLATSAQQIINPQLETPKPKTSQPETLQPYTPKPEAPNPETPQLENPQPESPQPETPPPPNLMFKKPRAPKLTKRMRKKHKRLQNVLLFIQNMRHQFVTDTLDSIIDFLSDPQIISRSFAPHTPGEQEFYRKCVHWCRNGYLAMISTEFHALQNRVLMLLKQVSCRVVKTSACKVNEATGLTEVTYIKPKLYHGPIPDHTQSSPKKQKVNLQTILKMAASGDTTNVSAFVNLYKRIGSSSARHKSWSDDSCGGSCSESDSNSDSSEAPTPVQTVPNLRNKKKNKKETKMKYRKANGRKAKSGRAGTNEAIELAKAECAEKPRLRRHTATYLNELNRKKKLKEALSVPVHSDKAMRMMLGMGWSGGALGPRGDGIKEPLMPALDIARGAGFGHNRNVKTVTLPKKPQEPKLVLSWITDTSNTSIPDTNDIVVQKTNQLLLKNLTFDSVMKITELPSSSKSNVQLLKPSPSIVELPTSDEELPKPPVSKFELPTSVSNKELPKPPVSIVELPTPSVSNIEFPTPSAPNSELPTPSTSKSEHLTPSASKVELPSQSASNVELPKPSASNVKLPKTLASNIELLKPSASNVKLPTTLASNVELLKPSALNVKLPTTLASNIELLKPSASNVKLPTTLASNVELLKPSASNVKLPTTLASNVELLKPSASNVKLPTTLASNVELPKPSASNVKLPTTLASNVELLKPSASNVKLPTTLASNIELRKPSALNVKLPTTLASNVELPKPSSPNSELLKSSALNSTLPKSSVPKIEHPTPSASNVKLPKSSAPNSVPPKSSAHNVEPSTPSASNVELSKPSAPNVELSKMIKEHKQLEISEFRLLFRKEILYNVYTLLNTDETCKILKYGQVIPKTCQMFVQYAMEALKSTQSNRGLFLPYEQEIYRKIQCKYQEFPDFIVKGFFSKDFMKINLHKVPVTAKEVKQKPIRAAKPKIITEANVQAFIAQYDTRPGTQKTYNSMKFRVLFLMNMLDFAKSSYEEVLINFNKALTVKQKSFVERAVEEINLRIRFEACVAEIKLSVEIRNHIKDAYLCIIIFRENRSVLISKTFPFKNTNTPENEVAGKSQTAFDTDYFSSNTIVVNEENNTTNSSIDQIYLDTEDSSDEEYKSINATAKVPELAHGKKAVNLSDYIHLYEKTKNSNNNDSASNEMTENINNKNNIGNGNIFFDNNDNQVIDMKRDFGKSEILAGRENIAEFVCTTEEISDPTLSDEDSKEETEQLLVKDTGFNDLKDEIMEDIVDEEVAIKGESIEVTKTCESKEVVNTNALLEVFNKFESKVTNKDDKGESIAEINKVESVEEINKVESFEKINKVESNVKTNKGELIKGTNKNEINNSESVKATNSVKSSEDMNVAQTEENSKNPSDMQMETESHSEAKTDCVIDSNEIIVLSEDDCDTETVVYRTNEPSTSKKPKVYNLSIVHTNHPIKKLTHGKVAEIQKLISKKIMQTKQLPLLMCQGFENGRLIYSCHNKNTYVWLQNTLSVVSQIKEFNSREVTRMAVTFYCYFDFVIDYLFKMIELYNRDLSTKDWIVEKTEKHGDYVTFIIRMDRFSINFIQASGLALFAGVDKVEFRPIWE